MNGLGPIWPPSRTNINGVSLGDAWPCSSMPNGQAWESIVPFHKLTQWLTYSLMQPMQSLLNMYFAGSELLTGLPEYRNGGLFIDLGVLTLKKDDVERGLENYSDYCRRKGVKPVEIAPMFEPSDDVIVEWRAVTVGMLDLLCVETNKALQKELAGNEMTLPQLLEAGSWRVRFSRHKLYYICYTMANRKITIGWPRNGRNPSPQYQRTPNSYRERWNCVLISLVLLLLPSLYIAARFIQSCHNTNDNIFSPGIYDFNTIFFFYMSVCPCKFKQ